MKIINFCIKYKYILTLIVFALYLFLGDNNILENRKLNNEIEDLESELGHYKTTVVGIKTQHSLSSINSKEEQEEYFRKHHHLKKENEDIFRIVYTNEK